MEKLPVLKARYAGAFAQALDSTGISTARLFRGLDISERMVFEDHESWMPVQQLCDFVEAVVYDSGRWDLGLDVSLVQRKQHSTFSKKYLFTPIETAQKLLARTDMPHYEISRELGYRHNTHFSRAFRRVCGMTPHQYRSSESIR